jgi:hypothetical protein
VWLFHIEFLIQTFKLITIRLMRSVNVADSEKIADLRHDVATLVVMR